MNMRICYKNFNCANEFINVLNENLWSSVHCTEHEFSYLDIITNDEVNGSKNLSYETKVYMGIFLYSGKVFGILKPFKLNSLDTIQFKLNTYRISNKFKLDINF